MSSSGLTIDGAAAEWASRRRHPSMRSGASDRQLRRRVADALDLSGTRHPDVAAAILSARGRSGLDVETFARRAGIAADVLVAAEAGCHARHQLPGVLRRLVPHPDR